MISAVRYINLLGAVASPLPGAELSGVYLPIILLNATANRPLSQRGNRVRHVEISYDWV